MTEAIYGGAASDSSQLVIAGALVALSILKGTAPGGPAARREFRQTQREEADTRPGWSIAPGPRKVL